MPSIQVRVDEDLKKQAQDVATALGMEVATAIRIFLCQMVRDRALPFTPSLAPKATVGYINQEAAPECDNMSREVWLRNAVHIGLKALENNDFATDEEIAETFKKAGVNVN